MQRRFGISVLLAAVLLATVWNEGVASQKGTLSLVRIAVFPASAQNWPLYVGDAQGYFTQAGLDVQITTIPSSPNAMQALVIGAIDIVSNQPDALFSVVQKNGPLATIISGVANITPYAVVAAPSVHSLRDLRGKVIGGTVLTSSVTYLLREYLKLQAGLGYEDYRFLAVGPTGQRLQALEAGQVQAVLLAQPEEFAAVEKGYRRVGYVSDALPAVGVVLMANTGWAKANADTVVRFLRAMHQAVRWLYEPANMQAAIDLLARRTNTAEKYATKTYDLLVSKLRTFSVDGTIPDRNVQILINLISSQGGLPTPAPKASRFEDMSYNARANQGD